MQDPILSEDDTSLSSLGICNGDLLWILSPTPSTSAPDPSPAHRIPQQPPNASQAIIGHIQGSSAPVSTAPTTSQTNLPQQQQEPLNLSQPMDVESESSRDLSGATGHEDDIEEPGEICIPIPIGLRIPGHLLRVLCSNPSSCDSPSGILLLAAHAAMLETGFCSAVTRPGSREWEDPHCLPSEGAVSSGMYRVQYTFKGPDPACNLLCSTMGESVLLAASTSDSKHSRHVMLDWGSNNKGKRWVMPAVPAELPPEGVDTLEAVQPCPHIIVTSGQRVILHRRWVLDYPMLRLLWNTLKDSLVLPTLAAACAAAGQPPPAGLLSLPAELKSAVLGALGALDLAALSATCSELRHLCATDELWKPLLDADFPRPPVEIADAIPRRGYKWAYAHCCVEKRRALEDSRRRRRRRYVIPGIPHFGPTPFYPAPPPRGFPGVIGGEQDRFPFLGGSGPGIGGPGRLFGASSSSNARRQGLPFGGGHRWV